MKKYKIRPVLICKNCGCLFSPKWNCVKQVYCKRKCFLEHSFKKANIIGKKYGVLTVLSFDHRDNCHTYWKCKCKCGKTIICTKNSLERGNSKSCGCVRIERFKKYITKHGLSKSPIYKVWHAMMQRCYNPNCKGYKNYGGRGITISDRWKNFDNFYNDFGKYKPKHNIKLSIDRIDNNGNYSKENCRFADIKTQLNNTSRNILLTYGDITKTLTQWNEIYKLPSSTIEARYKKGYSFEQIFSHQNLRYSMAKR